MTCDTWTYNSVIKSLTYKKKKKKNNNNNNNNGSSSSSTITINIDDSNNKMMSQADKRQETEISLPPSEDKVLSRLNQNYRLSKAQQILRLLKDQDDLNQRFRHCALLEDEDDGSKRRQDDDDEDAWSVHEGNRSGDEDDSDTSENGADRRAARRVALRKHRNSIDPGRCKTSMGFYNEAEVTEIPYDTDSDNVTGLDSACSTPRGVTSGALSDHKVYDAMGTGARATHVGAAIGNSGSSSSNNSRLRVYHLNMGESDVNVRELALPEDCVIQSARSSRPKTSMVSTSARSRNYRQQPHSESKPTKKAQNNHHNHSHNHGHGHTQNHSHTRNHSHNKNNNSHLMHHNHQSQPRGVGDTRQSIISRLDPHHPMAVRPFCESRGAAAQEELSPRPGGLHSSQPSTPRGGGGGEPTTPRGGSRANPNSYHKHTEVTLFDMAPSFSKDNPARSNSRQAPGGGAAAGSSPGTNITRSTSFSEHPRMLPANRPLLSVDSSPLLVGDVSPHPDESSRRPRSTRVKKRVGEMPRGAVSTSMHVIGERGLPAMTVMKLPPLETSVNKGGSGRDLVCVGKD